MNEPEDAGTESVMELTTESFGKPSLLARAINFAGTPRRLISTWLFPKYVERSHAMRRGECNRCGLCCQLVVKCVFLRFENGLASCSRYESRPPNCSQFPINQSDIDDVNRIAPHAPCGYSFAPPCSPGTRMEL